jgi:hypothetical protein
LTSDPEPASRIPRIREDGRELDGIYARNLAMIRKATQPTQAEVAERLGIGQGEVSKLERRDDLLHHLAGVLSICGRSSHTQGEIATNYNRTFPTSEWGDDIHSPGSEYPYAAGFHLRLLITERRAPPLWCGDGTPIGHRAARDAAVVRR